MAGKQNDDFNIPKISDMLSRAGSTLRRLKQQADRLKAEQRMLQHAERELEKNAKTVHGPKPQRVDVSTMSVVKATMAIFGLVGLAWFFLSISSIIITFLIAAFLAVAIDPFIDRMHRWGVPRGVGVLILYVVFFAFVGLVIAAFIPILTSEIPNLVNQVLTWLQDTFGLDTGVMQTQINEVQGYLTDIQNNLSEENLQMGLDVLRSIGDNALAVLGSVAGGVFSVGLVLVITFFMTLEEDGIKRFFLALFPGRYHGYIIDKATAVEEKFGGWLRGQLLLMLLMGVFTFIILSLLGVNYALSLALLAAFGELLPYVGPIIAMAPALIIAASQGGLWFALLILGVYLFIQQVEGNVFIPLVMKKAVGLSPVVIMFAMLVGASFPEIINPLVGIILAVPVATAISVFVQEYADRKK